MSLPSDSFSDDPPLGTVYFTAFGERVRHTQEHILSVKCGLTCEHWIKRVLANRLPSFEIFGNLCELSADTCHCI